ncbi:hypothetical protein TKK_0016479 [Trichogramma kaykai]|uniref:Ribosomal RNA-processing protein 12-like conserved domain-containing protein n=1 Tax=Trichogramma kaykai TaxID=54128 RepID=A0ABD2W7G8_9HYME
MGKTGPRLGSRAKAKRWAKGQSSSSNPETRKYRDAARSNSINNLFVQTPGTKPSNLTVDALHKHDSINMQASSRKDDMDMEEDQSCADSFKTFGTIASEISNCTNMSFDHLLNNFQPNSALQKEMLAVLAAVTEVIKEKSGSESNTEYFAALMTTLQEADTEMSISAILSLLGMNMKKVSQNVLRSQFSKASSIFIEILKEYASKENFLILRHCIGCISVLLRNQDASAWKNASTTQIMDGLLVFTLHSKPKVRKAAHHAVCSILKTSNIMNCDNPLEFHPAAPQIAKHCIAQLEVANQPGQITSTLHILSLLKDIAHQLPKSHVKSLCEALLSIMTLKNVLITSCCLQTLHGLFVSQPTEAVLPSQLNAQIINALYDYQPAIGDTQPTLAWLAVMQEAHCNLSRCSIELCAANIPRMVEKCTELWLSDKTEVIAGASHTLKTLIEVCVASFACNDQDLSQKYKPVLIKIIQFIKIGMKYQYHLAWNHVLHIFASVFRTIGKTCVTELSEVLVLLADLRDSHKFAYNAEIEYAVGAAIKSLGPEVVLRAIPLHSSNGEVDIQRSWLLPVLKDCISFSTLGFFIHHLMPLAISCEKKSKLLHEKKDSIGAHSNDLLVSQIWALLPSFCINPSDIAENFNTNFARYLGTIISQKKDLRYSVMAALRKLVQGSIQRSAGNEDDPDLKVISSFAKNYLPLLCDLYQVNPNGSDEDGQRLACYETLKTYLQITPQKVIDNLFDKTMDYLINEAEKSDELKKKDEENKKKLVKIESMFDVARILCQHTDLNRINKLYLYCVPYLKSAKNQKEQKKAYRFLEDLCSSDSKICEEFVRDYRKEMQAILLKSSSSVLKPSKGARIRCITHIVEKHPKLQKTKFLKAIVPEAVACLKELNEKCRNSAFKLLQVIGDKFLDNQENFEEYLQMLIAGLAGTPTHCSATFLALSSIVHYFSGSLGIQNVKIILQHATSLITGPTREIVQSVMSFIKVYLVSFPLPFLAPTIDSIVKSFSNMTEDCRRHYRQQIRDIMVKLMRKFGADVITQMVPTSDLIMHKRLKNMRKIEVSKQRKREEQRANQNEDSDEEFNIKRKPKSFEEILADSDNDYEDSDDDKKSAKSLKRKSKKQIYIQESEDMIVDFNDPTAAKNISTVKPVSSSSTNNPEKPKDGGFKTAPDGRLIIADSDNESDDGRISKKQSKILGLDSDASDDYKDEDDDKTLKSFKTLISNKSKKNSNSKKRKLDDGAESVVSSSSKYQAGGSGIHRPVKVRKQEKIPGEEYKHKKAFGDVKLKGKPEPYAYIPIRRADLNRRKKGKKSNALKMLSKSKQNKNAQKNSRRQ